MHEARLNYCYLSLKPGFLLCSLRPFSWSTSGLGAPPTPFKVGATILEIGSASLVKRQRCYHRLTLQQSKG